MELLELKTPTELSLKLTDLCDAAVEHGMKNIIFFAGYTRLDYTDERIFPVYNKTLFPFYSLKLASAIVSKYRKRVDSKILIMVDDIAGPQHAESFFTQARKNFYRTSSQVPLNVREILSEYGVGHEDFLTMKHDDTDSIFFSRRLLSREGALHSGLGLTIAYPQLLCHLSGRGLLNETTMMVSFLPLRYKDKLPEILSRNYPNLVHASFFMDDTVDIGDPGQLYKKGIFFTLLSTLTR